MEESNPGCKGARKRGENRRKRKIQEVARPALSSQWAEGEHQEEEAWPWPWTSASAASDFDSGGVASTKPPPQVAERKKEGRLMKGTEVSAQKEAAAAVEGLENSSSSSE